LACRLLSDIGVLEVEEVARLAHDHEPVLPPAPSHAEGLVALLLHPAREVCVSVRIREGDGGLTRGFGDSRPSGVRGGEDFLFRLLCSSADELERRRRKRSPELKNFGIQEEEEGFPSICSLRPLRL
jgi:hypothetical protein